VKGVIVVFKTLHGVYQSKELEPNITLQKVLDYFHAPVGELHRVGSEGNKQILKGDDTLIPPGVYRLVLVNSFSIIFSLIKFFVLIVVNVIYSCFIETNTIFHFLISSQEL
jgi:hypothetical protein